jgi:hypothetical protein
MRSSRRQSTRRSASCLTAAELWRGASVLAAAAFPQARARAYPSLAAVTRPYGPRQVPIDAPVEWASDTRPEFQAFALSGSRTW